jgi:hypothetical protein
MPQPIDALVIAESAEELERTLALLKGKFKAAKIDSMVKLEGRLESALAADDFAKPDILLATDAAIAARTRAARARFGDRREGFYRHWIGESVIALDERLPALVPWLLEQLSESS